MSVGLLEKARSMYGILVCNTGNMMHGMNQASGQGAEQVGEQWGGDIMVSGIHAAEGAHDCRRVPLAESM